LYWSIGREILARQAIVTGKCRSIERKHLWAAKIQCGREINWIGLRFNCTVRIIELRSSLCRQRGTDLSSYRALTARTGFGKLLRRVEDEQRSLVIEKRGTPTAVLLSIRDYVRLAAPEPEVLRVIGEESKRKGTNKLSSRRIDQIITTARAEKTQARMIALRLVVDTNIIVSAALKPNGLQRTVVLLAITKPARLFVTEEIVAEYRDVLSRAELKTRKGLRQQLLQLIQNRAHSIKPSHALQLTSDPDDNRFLECADAARADYLVTGNQRHFPKFWKKTKVINSRNSLILSPRIWFDDSSPRLRATGLSCSGLSRRVELRLVTRLGFRLGRHGDGV
jgi:putative PIN family toxin of toxin-antitoxin system